MKKLIKLLFSIVAILVLSMCNSDSNEVAPNGIEDQENSLYQVVNLEAGQDINSYIGDNTLINLWDSLGVYEIDETIIINDVHNLVINGSGSVIRFSENNQKIIIENSSNILLENVTIDNNNTEARNLTYLYDERTYEGRIEIINSDEVTLESLVMNEQNTDHGDTINGNQVTAHQVFLERSSNSNIRNCSFEGSQGELVFLRGSTNCLVMQSSMSGGWSGVGTTGMFFGEDVNGYDNNIINNTIKNCGEAYITINDRRAVVEGNTIFADGEFTNRGGPGIRFGQPPVLPGDEFRKGSNALCRNNIIRNLIEPSNIESYAISADYTQSNESNQDFSDLIIEGNQISNCNNGIKLSNQPGQYATIRNNDVNVNELALSLWSDDSTDDQVEPHSCLISDNTFISKEQVIKVRNSSVIIQDNLISSSSDFIYEKALFLETTYPDNQIKIVGNIFEFNESVRCEAIFANQGGSTSLISAIISGNIITNAYTGIKIAGSQTIISENTILNCRVPIYINHNASVINIFNNIVYSNHQACIYLRDTYNARIIGNFFNFSGSYNGGNTYPHAIDLHGNNASLDTINNVKAYYTNLLEQ